jgi:CubicO group peptidase (beta-lactamase class C family)
MLRARRVFVPLLMLVLAFGVLPSVLRAEESKIVEALKPYVERHTLAGAVALVANKDGVLATETVGYMDVAAQKPMAADATFWIASMSKPITSTALMMLVDDGKVNLDDPVEKYIPEFKGLMWIAEKDAQHTLLKAPAKPITVRQIMSHTAGLAFRSAVEVPTLDNLPLYQAVLSYTGAPLVYEPGTKYQYSNAGINTGGRIIEIVSHMPYEQFLQTRLFDPLGMKDTTFWPNTEQLARLAKSYKPNAAKDNLEETGYGQLLSPLSDHSKRYPMPAGGLFSTAADLAKFCRMLLNGGELDGKRYVSAAAIAEMSKRQTAPELKESYGLGWSVGDGWFGHGGAYATNMTVNVKKGLATIWMVQHAGFPGDGGKAQDAFRKAAEELFAK